MENGLTAEEVNAIYPIIGARLLDTSVVVLRLNASLDKNLRQAQQTTRGRVEYLSRRSRVNLGLVARENADKFRSLLTLTYGQAWPVNGRRVKRDLNLILTRLRQVYNPLSYLWFLEFQRRGAPHIHILLGASAGTAGERKWLADLWARIATDGVEWEYCQLQPERGRLVKGRTLLLCQAVRDQHNRERVWEPIRLKDGAARYVTKYSLKTRQKQVPRYFQDVGRFWGTSRDCRVDFGEMVFGSERQIREYLALRGRDMSHYQVLPRVVYI